MTTIDRTMMRFIQLNDVLVYATHIGHSVYSRGYSPMIDEQCDLASWRDVFENAYRSEDMSGDLLHRVLPWFDDLNREYPHLFERVWCCYEGGAGAVAMTIEAICKIRPTALYNSYASGRNHLRKEIDECHLSVGTDAWYRNITRLLNEIDAITYPVQSRHLELAIAIETQLLGSVTSGLADAINEWLGNTIALERCLYPPGVDDDHRECFVSSPSEPKTTRSGKKY